jgi:hypothetical protein
MGKLIPFNCRSCKAPLSIESKKRGQMTTCPKCTSVTRVPLGSGRGVDMEMTLPGGGGWKGRVKKSDSGKVAFCFAGGILAILGVIFGFNMGGGSVKKF